jgi:hypothetical protein
MGDMRDSNIRTLTVRFSEAEHRLLSDLANDQRIDLETLVREALTLGPIAEPAVTPHLRVVRGDELSVTPGANRGQVLPSS